MRALKGHGTQNDFVVLPDLDGVLDLRPEFVRALCDRHAGIGADGVLRVVRSQHHAEAKAVAAEAQFFMDYRNADGSLAEMCGNGLRLFMRYLQRAGLVEHDATVATRGGILRVRSGTDGNVSVEMGQPRILADRPVVTVALCAPRAALAAVAMPNPHVIVQLEHRDELDALDLSRPPRVVPALPEGQNVEFIVRVDARRLTMRVHERGSGETRSCGTGICAVVVAAAAADGSGPDGSTWQVDVPGGTCTVVWRPDGGIVLSGPAVIVAEIELDEDWLAAVR
jgi:diaminopimelate epimerase